ncbi:hypothetical protein HYS94_05450 [Candidatus Daviesbacteria bacterium]|nr:hypothetical protein [Candidatus Daviesbacteria bacterium]
MADSASGIKQIGEEVVETTEEVVKDTKDQVGQAIEQGVQSVVGIQLTPQQIQQRQLDEQKKLAKVRRDIQWYKDIQVAQKAIREKEKQKKLQKDQQIQDEKKFKQMEIIQKKKELPIAIKALGKAEIKRGIGG